MKKIDMKTKNR